MGGEAATGKRVWTDAHGPIIILVEPQMAENIGTVARAMANFGLTELRMVAPRDGWPNKRAYPSASGANAVLDNARLFASYEEAIADLSLIFAATARVHDQAKPVVGPVEAVARLKPHLASGQKAAIVFGRERNGLLAEEVGLADAILTYPVNPGFASLNLAQAVLLIAFEWYKTAVGDIMPQPVREALPASREQMLAFFVVLEAELDRVEFFRPTEKRDHMILHLRNIFLRMNPLASDLATLRGAIHAIAEGAKGPARGGTLNEKGAAMLRTILAQRAEDEDATSPAKGLARLARRNPSEAERLVWDALTKDHRLCGRGYKRAVPIGPHLADFVSFAEKRVILVITPDTETMQAHKAEWLQAREYRVTMLDAQHITDVAAVADWLAHALR